MQLFLQYCCLLLTGTSHCLHLPDKIQKCLVNLVCPDICTNLHSLFHWRNVASLSLFYKYFHGHCLHDLHEMTPSVNFFSWYLALVQRSSLVQVPNCIRNFACQTFFSCTAFLWNSLPHHHRHRHRHQHHCHCWQQSGKRE